MTYTVQTRRMDVLYPFTCVVCKKEIVKGERYINKKGSEKHEECV